MKYISEIIVLFNDFPMPEVSGFFPSAWSHPNSNTDGDFYWDGFESRWTELKIKKKYAAQETIYRLNICRENGRVFDSGVCEANDLLRYVDYKNSGRYRGGAIDSFSDFCVASFFVNAASIEDYREYLSTIHWFMLVSGGVEITLAEYSANDFMKEVIQN